MVKVGSSTERCGARGLALHCHVQAPGLPLGFGFAAQCVGDLVSFGLLSSSARPHADFLHLVSKSHSRSHSRPSPEEALRSYLPVVGSVPQFSYLTDVRSFALAIKLV